MVKGIYVRVAGEYLIFVDENREKRVIKKINEFEESLAFFFADSDGCEEECFQMYDELLSFIARNGNFVKIKGLQVADIVLPPSDISFEELRELWHIRTKHKEEKE